MSLHRQIRPISWIVTVCAPLPMLAQADSWPTNIFAPASTPAHAVFRLSIFVLIMVTAIFIVVFSLLTYAVVRFRSKRGDDRSEPAQIYGSSQVELAWTVIPILIVVALFLAAARVIASVQGAHRPPGTLE